MRVFTRILHSWASYEHYDHYLSRSGWSGSSVARPALYGWPSGVRSWQSDMYDLLSGLHSWWRAQLALWRAQLALWRAALAEWHVLLTQWHAQLVLWRVQLDQWSAQLAKRRAQLAEWRAQLVGLLVVVCSSSCAAPQNNISALLMSWKKYQTDDIWRCICTELQLCRASCSFTQLLPHLPFHPSPQLGLAHTIAGPVIVMTCPLAPIWAQVRSCNCKIKCPRPSHAGRCESYRLCESVWFCMSRSGWCESHGLN